MPTSSNTIVVTGAASGFGYLTAITLAHAGYDVHATFRDVMTRNADAAKQLRTLTENAKGSLRVTELDVTDETSVQRAISSIYSTSGKIDTLIHNAGLGGLGIIETFTLEQIQAIFNVNTFGPLRVNRAVLPIMREQKSGLLIYVTSAGGRLCFPFLGVYNGSKYAIEAIAETSRYELEPLGIHTAIVEPGAFLTELHPKRLVPQGDDRLKGYGQLADIPAQMVDGMLAALSGDGAPQAQEVADAIKALIAQPHANRPLRTVVGKIGVSGIKELNEANARSQEMLLKSMGMA